MHSMPDGDSPGEKQARIKGTEGSRSQVGLLFHTRWLGSLTGDLIAEQRLKATEVLQAGGCVAGTAKRPAWLEHGERGDMAGLVRPESGRAGEEFKFLL